MGWFAYWDDTILYAVMLTMSAWCLRRMDEMMATHPKDWSDRGFPAHGEV